ncbi:hypothetical protein BDV26DRAFT_290351 [Aspergillus bertholletiae]|uniref:Uncharacterized protein n=1 Tax=Aspergillus bertholletiae TaxID=1226010 RepID=A0A5N7BF59_9EURO|nr:hypothetical protein BDV26DRAFT_290351 [Aspergillus bertholletiae]
MLLSIYIETQPSADEQTRNGLMYHVVGNILQGMTYQKRDTKDPLLSATYVAQTKKKIGTIKSGNLTRFETECCNLIAPPGPQVTLGGKRKDPFTDVITGSTMLSNWRFKRVFLSLNAVSSLIAFHFINQKTY